MKILLAPLLLLLAACSHPGFSSSPGASGGPAARSSSASGIINPRGADFLTAPEKIAFGSCSDQDRPQPIWKSIVAAEPDLYLAMGDTIYATSPERQVIEEQYRKLDKIAEYREAREKIPFLATWDDGDLGTRDGGADAPTKAQARKEFLTHFRYVKDSLPLNRDGLYHAKILGGQITGRRRKRVNGPAVQVIMLDTRSFRSPLKSEKLPEGEVPGFRYVPNEDKGATVLGEEQWSWLADRLREPAQLHLIISSIQLIPAEHPFEKWANFPRERERFFEVLRKSPAKNVVIFSGDRHQGSIAKTDIKGWGTLYEITSSSLNRPSTLPPESDSSYLAASYPQENFGLASLDWRRKRMKVELRDLEGKEIQSVEIKLR